MNNVNPDLAYYIAQYINELIADDPEYEITEDTILEAVASFEEEE